LARVFFTKFDVLRHGFVTSIEFIQTIADSFSKLVSSSTPFDNILKNIVRSGPE